MSRSSPRTSKCGRAEAVVRLRQAQAYVRSAELVLDEIVDDAAPGVAAALAVLAGIAAADAICCRRLGRRARGQDHREAERLLSTASPEGATMARDLRELLVAKDDSHYGATLVSRAKAGRMVERAARMVASATSALA